MAVPSGLSAQLGISAETTWATRVAPSKWLEFVDESMELDIQHIESAALRSGNSVLRSDRQKINKKGAAGDISFEVTSSGYGLLLEHMFGAIATATPGGATNARTHTATIGDLTGKSLTVQVGKPDIGGTVRPFEYPGAKVASWELTCDIDGILMLRLSLDAYDEDTGQTLGTAAPSATDELLVFTGGTVTIGGASACVRAFSVAGDNGLGVGRYCIGESRKKEQLESGRREFTGSVEVYFEDLTQYNRFTSGTPFAFEATFAGIADGIESGFANHLKVTLPAVRADGETPKVSGPEELTQTIPMKVLDNDTDEPITIEYQTADTAP